MGSRQIVLVSTAGFSVLNTGIFWREAKTKRLFSLCRCFFTVEMLLFQFLFLNSASVQVRCCGPHSSWGRAEDVSACEDLSGQDQEVEAGPVSGT